MSEEPRTPGSDSIAGLPDATLRALDVGQLIAGRFRLVRPLGKGGMGVVWLAQDESLGEEVAFKFLSEVFAQDEASLHDLKRELRRSRQLTHAHIIRVHDLVEDPARGVAGITMEVAAGGSLAARRARTGYGWFEPAEIAEWMQQLAAALDYAHHTARIVHRDLKPANLLLDAEGRLKIADFGISAALHETATRLTAGKISGTPLYMSPEQWQGHPPAPSDDLYAFGATIYDLLTGKPPFYSGHIAAAALHLTPVAIRERRRELQGVDAPVPFAWEQAVAALLAKTAADRPASAEAALTPLQISTSTVDRPISTPSAAPAETAATLASETLPAGTSTPPAPSASPIPRKSKAGRNLLLGFVLALSILAVWWAQRKADLPQPQTSIAQPEIPKEQGIAHPPQRLPQIEWPGPAVTFTPPVYAVPGEAIRLRIPQRIQHNPFGTFSAGPFGFVDETGREVIARRWEDAGDFSENRALVSNGGTPLRFGCIDPEGNVAIDFKWAELSPFSQGYAVAARELNGSCSFIYLDGSVSLPRTYFRLQELREGLAWAMAAPAAVADRWECIDATGKSAFPGVFTKAEPYSENFAVAGNAAGKLGYLDQSGHFAIAPTFADAGPFSEGLARVRREPGGPLSFIRTDGSEAFVVPGVSAGDFSEDLAVVAKSAGGPYGYIDPQGQVAIPPVWEKAGNFQGGLAVVANGLGSSRYYGLIDHQGKIVVPPEWSLISAQRITWNGPVYRFLCKRLSATEAQAFWLDPSLKTIWSATLPIEK